MSRFFKAVGIFATVGVLVLLVGWFIATPHSLPDSDNDEKTTEIADISEMIKNPYKLKGQTVFLDPKHLWIPTGDGHLRSVPCFGSCFTFDRMINDHTATYSVGLGQQFALLLDDSNPPSLDTPWRVRVEGTEDYTNGLGVEQKGLTLRFRGYGVIPTIEPIPSEQPMPVPTTPQEKTPTAPQELEKPQDEQTPAPIIRQPPSNTTPDEKNQPQSPNTEPSEKPQ